MTISAIESTLSVEFERATKLLPRHLRGGFRQYAYFAGGCIYCLYNDREPKDYDIFISDEAYVQHILSYFQRFTKPEESFKGFLAGTYKGHKLLISEYAITIGKYQIIVKYIGKPKDVVEQFDFKHNMFSFCGGKVESFTDWNHIESTALVFNEGRARDICGTILRIPKFVDRGMTISRSEMTKMLRTLDNVGFDDNERKALRNEEHY